MATGPSKRPGRGHGHGVKFGEEMRGSNPQAKELEMPNLASRYFGHMSVHR